MSEYQSYEFVAVDRPLTAVQQGELRALSTRARITSSSFVNDYQWGDLKGDPRNWMERYFDAHLYLANWGTHRVALRLPRTLLDRDTAAIYCVGEAAHSWATREHVILDLSSEDEDGDEWWDDEGRLASIVPVRAELAAGDMRLLYVAWLLCPGQGTGRGRGRAARTTRSRGSVGAASQPGRLPAAGSGPARRRGRSQRDAAGEGAVGGGADQVGEGSAGGGQGCGGGAGAAPRRRTSRSELLRRYDGRSAPAAAGGGRTVGELLASAEARWATRQRLAEERKAAERARREMVAAAAREQRLNALAAEQDQAWRRVAAMIETKKPREYDAAVELLADLKALAERDRQTTSFRQRIRRLREEHARKPSLLDRLDRARLG